jgi:uncharacterized protein YbjQ (UPF0145 family)
VARGQGDIDYAKSLRQVANGGLPIRAAQRLAEEAGPHRRLFTSDLSVNELLLAREAGCEVVAQVMGSSIYHIGKIPDYKGSQGGKSTYELPKISAAHREARAAAIQRLRAEALAVQADAVIGVHLGERLITMGAHGKGGDDGDEVIEFTVIGTAIRARQLVGPRPILSDLSGQDFWALLREGWAPCGIVFDFCRWHVWHVLQGWRSGEVTEATAAIRYAREVVERRVAEQAAALHAEAVVGSDLKVRAHEVPCGYEGCELNDLDVDVSWFGTAIRRLPDRGAPPAAADVPALVLGMMPLGLRRRRAQVEEADESEALRRAGEAAEEAAAE